MTGTLYKLPDGWTGGQNWLACVKVMCICIYLQTFFTNFAIRAVNMISKKSRIPTSYIVIIEICLTKQMLYALQPLPIYLIPYCSYCIIIS